LGASDRLVGGATPVAASVEIHTMHMDGAVMRMRRQDGVDVPVDGALKLEPGGTHLMLMGLKAPLAAGRTFDLALDFAGAGRKEVRVKVLPIGATGPRDQPDE
jgi:copper(I)-binding protein